MVTTRLRTSLSAPDLEAQSLDLLAPRLQGINALPVPWVESIDIANAVAFLVSDEARYITGVALPVDCGSLLL